MLQVRAPQPVRDPGRFLRRRAEHAHVDLAVGLLGRGIIGGIVRTDPRPPGTRPGEPRGQPGGGSADRRSGTAVHAEHHEGSVHGVEARRIRAAEAEHGLVRVAREHDGAGRAPQHPHQLHLLRVEVLRVVDQEVPHPGTLGREQLGIAGQRVQRGADQLGGIQRGGGHLRRAPADRTAQQHDLLIGAEEATGRYPLRHVVLLPQRLQLVRPEPAFGCPQQQFAQLGGEARHADRRPQPLRPARSGHCAAGPAVELAVQQVSHHGVLLRAREEPRRGVAVAGGVQAQYAEGVGVHGADERLAGGADTAVTVHQPGQPRPQLPRGPAAADEQQHSARLGPRTDPPGRRSDEQRRLPRAGAADDPQRAGVVLEHPARRRLPLRFGFRDARGPDEQGHARVVENQRSGHMTIRPRTPDSSRRRCSGGTITGWTTRR